MVINYNKVTKQEFIESVYRGFNKLLPVDYRIDFAKYILDKDETMKTNEKSTITEYIFFSKNEAIKDI